MLSLAQFWPVWLALSSLPSTKAIGKPVHLNESSYLFSNDKTKPYAIDSFPDVHWNTGEFYSGNVAIDEDDPGRTLFFVFKPAMNVHNGDTYRSPNVTIWLNGGPGCSSLVGFFQENGPILWQPGTAHPVRNPWTWAHETNMLWVEYPVGVGFTTGKVTARNETSAAKDFVGFFKNWSKLFGIEGYKIFVTGESYAGRYVPYISAEMLDQNDKTYFDLGGALVYDPCIGSFIQVGMNIPTYPFVKANNAILGLDQSTLDHLQKVDAECGYDEWMRRYLAYPPSGNQPQIGSYAPHEKCDVSGIFFDAWYKKNPCLNVYHITDTCPKLADPVGEFSFGRPYFDRPDVMSAIHAPPHKKSWSECGERYPFAGFRLGPEHEGDFSLDPIQSVLPKVIEATNRVLIGNGDFDGLLLTNGTLLSIQNMTWNGKLGFQDAPSGDFVVGIGDYQRVWEPQGIVGKQHFERGLQWVETFQAGHQEPQYQPRASIYHLRWLLGIIPELPSTLQEARPN